MRSFFLSACLVLGMFLPLQGVAWETSGDGILYTMEDLVDSTHGAVTTVDSVKFIISEFITIMAGDTLVVDPGDSLCFQNISPVIVLKINGYLLSAGTAEDPIVFTSNEASPDTSNWGRIEFENNPAGSIVDHCHISYAATAIFCDSSALATISNTVISAIGSNGISLKNSSPFIRNCSITDFNGSGIVCTGTSQPLVGGSVAAANTMYNAIPPTGFTFKNFTANAITATHNDWGIQDYVYIDSIIVDDDENAIYGPVVFIPIFDIVPPAAIADLEASPADSNISLSWSAVTADTSGNGENLSHYVIYRDTIAFFTPQGAYSVASVTGQSFIDSFSTMGDITTNSYYLVMAVDDAGNKSGPSNRVGEYDWSLEATPRTDYTWISVPLHVDGLLMVSDLEARIEAHSSPSTNCYKVSRWNAAGQFLSSYITDPIPLDDFPLQPGGAYRVEVSNDATWSGQ